MEVTLQTSFTRLNTDGKGITSEHTASTVPAATKYISHLFIDRERIVCPAAGFRRRMLKDEADGTEGCCSLIKQEGQLLGGGVRSFN